MKDDGPGFLIIVVFAVCKLDPRIPPLCHTENSVKNFNKCMKDEALGFGRKLEHSGDH